MSPALEVRNLSKTYCRWWSRKGVHALVDVDLTVERGSIFGLLGPNGAGKTSLIKIALTIAHPTRGEVVLLGQENHDRSIFKRVGYLPENPRFPTHLTARNVLRLYGSMSGRDMKYIRQKSPEWLERVGLSGWERVRVAKFSRGMVERLAFAQAVIHDPDLIFLDEPTDGLDPIGRMEMRKICRELADAGKTIFINSHILAEIETVCDRVALMKEGRILDVGSVADFTSGGETYEVTVATEDDLSRWFESQELRFSSHNGQLQVVLPDRNSANQLIDTLRTRGVEIESVTPRRKSLESVFLERVC
jgi:ABC-2 type transport system ATP-binding protein